MAIWRLRDISCEVHEGVAACEACLPTHYLKQVAQATVAEVEGVAVVMNQIEVTASGNDSPTWRGDGSRRCLGSDRILIRSTS